MTDKEGITPSGSEGPEGPLELGSGAARSRPLARLAALLSPLFLRFVVLPPTAFSNPRVLTIYLSILLRPWRRFLLACCMIHAFLLGWMTADFVNQAIQACDTGAEAQAEANFKFRLPLLSKETSREHSSVRRLNLRSPPTPSQRLSNAYHSMSLAPTNRIAFIHGSTVQIINIVLVTVLLAFFLTVFYTCVRWRSHSSDLGFGRSRFISPILY